MGSALSIPFHTLTSVSDSLSPEEHMTSVGSVPVLTQLSSSLEDTGMDKFVYDCLNFVEFYVTFRLWLLKITQSPGVWTYSRARRFSDSRLHVSSFRTFIDYCVVWYYSDCTYSFVRQTKAQVLLRLLPPPDPSSVRHCMFVLWAVGSWCLPCTLKLL